tara:strand:+ start:4766 stop:5293 length:528 start_codon:yes stop_codon:yes gene_type:complete
MENIYHNKVEESLQKALPNILYYLTTGIITGSILETIMPEFNEKKDFIALFLEIFAQITIVVFIFMFLSSKGGFRNGVIVFIFALIGSQPTLLQKIVRLRELVLSIKPSKKKTEESFEDMDETEIKKKINEDEKKVKKESVPPPVLKEKTELLPVEQTENVFFSGATSIDNLPMN